MRGGYRSLGPRTSTGGDVTVSPRAGSARNRQGGRLSDSGKPVPSAARVFRFPAPPTATIKATRGSGAGERWARRSRGHRPVPAPVAASRERRAGRPRRAARSSAPARRLPPTVPGRRGRRIPPRYRSGSSALTGASVPVSRGRGFGRGPRQRRSIVAMVDHGGKGGATVEKISKKPIRQSR